MAEHGTQARPAPIRWRCDAVIRLGGGTARRARIDLVGGRNRHSVGGELAEGPRWWHGRIGWLDEVEAVPPGTQIELELDDGKSRTAVVESGEGVNAADVPIRGLGAPPFDVDGRGIS